MHLLSLAPHHEPPHLQVPVALLSTAILLIQEFSVCLAGDSWDRIDPHHAVYARTVTRAVEVDGQVQGTHDFQKDPYRTA